MRFSRCSIAGATFHLSASSLPTTAFSLSALGTSYVSGREHVFRNVVSGQTLSTSVYQVFSKSFLPLAILGDPPAVFIKQQLLTLPLHWGAKPAACLGLVNFQFAKGAIKLRMYPTHDRLMWSLVVLNPPLLACSAHKRRTRRHTFYRRFSNHFLPCLRHCPLPAYQR